MDFPESLRYTDSHEWIKVEGKTAKIGISDFAQKELGDIVFVELPQLDQSVGKGDACAVVESVKTASDIYCPVAGKIVAVNEELDTHPELVNEDCYTKGWIFEIEVSDPSQVDSLLSAEEYMQKYA